MGSNKFEWMARAGYAARGLVYVLVGLMALLGSIGGGSPDSESALEMVLSQPFGRIWLGLIGLFLVGFIVWRLAQSLANADNHPAELKGYVIRLGLLVSAITYTGLAIFAVTHALLMGSQEAGNGSQSWTAWLMQQPYGRYLVGAVGLCILGAGAAHIVKGFRRSYHRYLAFDANLHPAVDTCCVYGLVAKGVVFLIIGVFFLYAAFMIDAEQAGSMSDALTWVRQLPFGGVLYLAIGLGLACFGIYGFVEARYRRVAQPSLEQARRSIPAI